MKQWTVTFSDDPAMSRVRADKARRLAHIAFVRERPELQIGGPLAMTPMQDFPGAIWTIQAETQADVEQLILSDPYYVATLRRYNMSAWGDAVVGQAAL